MSFYQSFRFRTEWCGCLACREEECLGLVPLRYVTLRYVTLRYVSFRLVRPPPVVVTDTPISLRPTFTYYGRVSIVQ